MNTAHTQRLHVEISGTVQGIGFRPFCYHLATRFKLTGWIANQGKGVVIEIQGANTRPFIEQLKLHPPPAAHISHIHSSMIPLIDEEKTFNIRASSKDKHQSQPPPDRALCENCREELFNSQSRFYRYPFINCTACGPRYSILKALPYDRANTAMDAFTPCTQCQQDYNNPNNRRFHAQGICCPACGPQLSHSIEDITQAIHLGKIIALKNAGGFHLICDAHNEHAINLLRSRKQRPSKALAMMAADVTTARQFSHLNNEEELLLASPQRPIVLLKKRDGLSLPASIAPDTNTYGIMLPYTPVHYLLFETLDTQALIVTSANASKQPVITNNDEAQQKLSSLADLIVEHSLDISQRNDDSVIQHIENQTIFIRRARAYTPESVQLAHPIPSVLAVGGHLKNTICLTRGDQAFVSQHLGDLTSRANYGFFESTVEQFKKLLNVQPEIIAHDLHPDFYSTRYAQQTTLQRCAIQHHHAHIAAVAAEYCITEPVLGLALDGYGYGEEGSAWGGELFLYEDNHIRRLAHLKPLVQIGGERAVKEPWRMAAAFLASTDLQKNITKRFPYSATQQLVEIASKPNIHTTTTSCGRLFDAAASLLGVADFNDYESQAAIKLERLANQPRSLDQGWRIENEQQLDFTPLLSALAKCPDAREGANFFHGTLIEGLAALALLHAKKQQTNTILLSGGCFLNRTLACGLTQRLQQENIKALLPKRLPPNDGGLSLGQAWLAGNQALSSRTTATIISPVDNTTCQT